MERKRVFTTLLILILTLAFATPAAFAASANAAPPLFPDNFGSVIYYKNYEMLQTRSNGEAGSYEENGLKNDASYEVKSNETTGISRSDPYFFTSWNTAKAGTGMRYIPGEILTVDGELTLYAQWGQPTYSVTYDANGGLGSHIDTGISHSANYVIDNSNETGITKPNHTLSGWNTQPDGGGTPYDLGESITLDGDLILYAQWEEDVGINDFVMDTDEYELSEPTGANDYPIDTPTSSDLAESNDSNPLDHTDPFALQVVE